MESEEYLLRIIMRGARMVAQRHVADCLESTTSGDLGVSLPDLTEPEAYYDAIADILQTADHMGFNPERLCDAALDQQRSFRKEAQDVANELRGPGTKKSRS
jgi:hypothetical protein